jgi:hypothetical protein
VVRLPNALFSGAAPPLMAATASAFGSYAPGLGLMSLFSAGAAAALVAARPGAKRGLRASESAP